ncbi:MAG: cytidylate kinase family protein, partial [Chloroflexi bacterium]|nr:cytidylate kinase family protein [Chloroflexota bacterium]
MPVITINGKIGSGVREIGSLVARILNIDYVDRLVLSEASKRIGATVAALAEKEARITPFRQRLGRVLQN